jgi:hypothetical protein
MLFGKTEAKRPLRRAKGIGQDNIRMDLTYDLSLRTGLNWFRIRRGGGEFIN